MEWTPPARPLRSDTKAPANSIANTAVSSASHPCGIFGLSAHPALRRWSRSVIGQARYEIARHPPMILLSANPQRSLVGHEQCTNLYWARHPGPASFCLIPRLDGRNWVSILSFHPQGEARRATSGCRSRRQLGASAARAARTDGLLQPAGCEHGHEPMRGTVISDCAPLAGSFPVRNPARNPCIVVIRKRSTPTSLPTAKTVTTPAKWKRCSGTTSKNRSSSDSRGGSQSGTCRYLPSGCPSFPSRKKELKGIAPSSPICGLAASGPANYQYRARCYAARTRPAFATS